MSTATAFRHHRPFPFCPTSGTIYPDHVDVTLAAAMAFYWNLEGISFTSTGAKGVVDVNWTVTLGATPDFSASPFAGTGTGSGAYYVTGPAASPPINRACSSSHALLYLETATSGAKTYSLTFVFLITASGNPALPVRIQYSLIMGAYEGADSMIICGPNYGSVFIGTIPSSGTISILGIPFGWIGGGYDGMDTWTGETVTLSCASSAFTY